MIGLEKLKQLYTRCTKKNVRIDKILEAIQKEGYEIALVPTWCNDGWRVINIDSFSGLSQASKAPLENESIDWVRNDNLVRKSIKDAVIAWIENEITKCNGV